MSECTHFCWTSSGSRNLFHSVASLSKCCLSSSESSSKTDVKAGRYLDNSFSPVAESPICTNATLSEWMRPHTDFAVHDRLAVGWPRVSGVDWPPESLSTYPLDSFWNHVRIAYKGQLVVKFIVREFHLTFSRSSGNPSVVPSTAWRISTATLVISAVRDFSLLLSVELMYSWHESINRCLNEERTQAFPMVAVEGWLRKEYSGRFRDVESCFHTGRRPEYTTPIHPGKIGNKARCTLSTLI